MNGSPLTLPSPRGRGFMPVHAWETVRMTDIEKALADAAWPYWEAEGEIAKRFFAKATDEDHIFYLRASCGRN